MVFRVKFLLSPVAEEKESEALIRHARVCVGAVEVWLWVKLVTFHVVVKYVSPWNISGLENLRFGESSRERRLKLFMGQPSPASGDRIEQDIFDFENAMKPTVIEVKNLQ